MRLLGWLLVKIPRRWLIAVGAALGWLVYVLGIRRRVVRENLALAFPEKTEAERAEIARRTYRSLGEVLVEFPRVPFLPREELERLFVYEGWENLLAARARGKGVLVATAHFGNFDLLATAHMLKGYPVLQISRRMGRAGNLWKAFRRTEDIVIRRGETLKAMTRALKAGRVIGWVIDQNENSRRAIFPTFFGVPAATSSTPAILAMRMGVAVVFVVSIPLGDGRHRVVLEGPLDPPDTGDRDRDALAFMQDLNDRLERQVRAHPERWYWLHRRWKTRPPSPPAAPAPSAGELAPPGRAGGSSN